MGGVNVHVLNVLLRTQKDLADKLAYLFVLTNVTIAHTVQETPCRTKRSRIARVSLGVGQGSPRLPRYNIAKAGNKSKPYYRKEEPETLIV